MDDILPVHGRYAYKESAHRPGHLHPGTLTTLLSLLMIGVSLVLVLFYLQRWCPAISNRRSLAGYSCKGGSGEVITKLSRFHDHTVCGTIVVVARHFVQRHPAHLM